MTLILLPLIAAQSATAQTAIGNIEVLKECLKLTSFAFKLYGPAIVEKQDDAISQMQKLADEFGDTLAFIRIAGGPATIEILNDSVSGIRFLQINADACTFEKIGCVKNVFDQASAISDAVNNACASDYHGMN